jgi:hypothetical protein
MNGWLEVISEPVNPIQVNLSLPGVECFLPVAIICGVCVLATAVWMLVVGKYALSRGRHP